jgi:hypothetical protein
MCSHGGTVQIVSSNTQAMAGGVPAALATDLFIIAGCPFIIGIVPSPCLTVQWIVPDMRTTVNGTPTLSQSSVGLCLSPAMAPQGPVIILNAQPQVQTQ